MLVLTRKKKQVVRIGKDTVITVIKIHNDYVRLGITAPAEIPVHREEVFDRIQRDKR